VISVVNFLLISLFCLLQFQEAALGCKPDFSGNKNKCYHTIDKINTNDDMCVPFTGTEAWTSSMGYKMASLGSLEFTNFRFVGV
ncbi:unnamed protein product, partial [Linum tenue]